MDIEIEQYATNSFRIVNGDFMFITDIFVIVLLSVAISGWFIFKFFRQV